MQIKKIAVLRANGLGDFIVSLPAFDALRKTFPKAEIVLLSRSWVKDFLKNRQLGIDRVIGVPDIEGGNKKIKLETFSKLAVENFDLAIQMHGGGRNSNPLILRLNAKKTIGLRTPDAPLLDRWLPYIYFQNEVFRFLELVSLIGAKTEMFEPQLKTSPEDLSELTKVIDLNPPFIVVHAGASDARRRWPIIKYIKLANILIKQKYRVVITGTREEKELSDQLKIGTNNKVIDMFGKLSVNGLTGLLSKALLLISNDTGPLHLGRSLGIKTVGIYWGPNLINWGPISRAKNRTVVSWNLNCPECKKNFMEFNCIHRKSCVSDIALEDVIDKVSEIINL